MATEPTDDNKAAEQEKEQEKAKEASKQKEASVVCSIEFSSIITALHEKALSQIKEEAYTIQNSAIDGEGKDAKFYGAGSHIIVAIPKENKGLDKNKIPKDVALRMIQTYVQWFVGPDLKTGIADKDLLPLESEDSGKVEDTHKKKQDVEKSRGSAAGSEKASTASKEKYKESCQQIPSFSQYLLLEDNGEASSEGSSEASGNLGTDADNSSNADDSGSAETAPDASASTDSATEGESASGYYITYQLEVKPGEKGKSSIADALKKMGADLLKGFGIQVSKWGSTGEVHTIGDLMNSLDAVFGKIDPKELEEEYNKEMAKRFKDGDYSAKVFDTKTIIKHLNKKLAGSDKSKIKSAEMALCTKVDKKDKSYKLYNKQVIADAITSSIKGIFKKFNNKVTAKDVILVNNYSDNKKSKGEVKYTEKGEGSVEDSLAVSFPGRIITEALSVEDRRKSIKQKLEELAKKNLGDAYKKSDALPSTEVVEILKKNGIDEPKLFAQLQDAQNSFYICTIADNEEQDESPKEQSDEPKKESIAAKNMLKMLFEATSSELKDLVEKTFSDLVFSFKDYLPKGKDVSEKEIHNVKEYVAANPTESLMQHYGLISQIFDDLTFDDYSMLLERSGRKHANKQRRKKLKAQQLNAVQDQSKTDPDIKLIPKAPKDPTKPTEDLEPIGDPISYDPKKPIKEQLPELPERDGREPNGWNPDPESIKDPKENIEIIGKYKKKDAEAKNHKVLYWAIPDENGLLDKLQFKFYDIDPENPDDKTKWTPIDGYDSTADANELDFPAKDKLTSIENYKFADEWIPSKEQLKSYDINNPDEKDLVTDKKTKTQYIAIRPVYTKNAFKFYDVDPEKPNDKSKWKPIENYKPTSTPDKVEFPTKDDLANTEEYKFADEWIPSKEQLKSYDINNPDEKDLVTDKKTKTQYIAIRPVYTKNALSIKLVITDPEDPDNTKSQKTIDIQVIDGKYKVDDLNQLAKDTESKDEAAKYANAAKKNQEAFKSVENIAELEKAHQPYKFLGWTTDENGSEPTFEKKEIQEVIDEVISSGKEPEDNEVILKTVWSNDIKAVHTELDFYIVPMKGLKDKSHYDNATGRTVDG